MEPRTIASTANFFPGEARRWGLLRSDLRQEWGIRGGGIVLVFSGKLIPKKDPLLIPAMIGELPESLRCRIHLLVAGDGELRPAMEAACREALGDRVRFFGFLNQTEIGRVYAAGNLLVLPSRRGAGETWGLVVNEAMQFGLSVLASDGVGCAPDLVTPETGRVFRSGDSAAAAAAFRDLVDARVCSGLVPNEAAVSKVAGFSAEAAARGLIAAVSGAAGESGR